MYTKAVVKSAWPALCAALIACTMFAGEVAAEDGQVTVAIHVSARGLDLNTSTGAHELYSRLKNAAWIACTRANRVGLEPSPDPEACSEKALGEAVRSAHVPQLVQVYLATHSVGQAAAYGIDVPVQVAAK